MKNNIYISLAVGALISLSSCSDSYLQEDYAPALKIAIDENTIKTNEDLQNSIRGLYASLSSTSGFGGSYFTYQELTGDLGFVSIKNSGYFVSTNAENHLLVDGGASSGLWASFYNTIANANFVLSYEGKIPDSSEGSLAKSKTLFAHARVIRAYNYLTLLGLFSPNYGEGDQSLGVPYSTSYKIDAKLPRASVSTVINSVIADLESSLALFANDSNSAIYASSKSFNVDAIKLLLSRAYLFKKDYAKAQQYAQQVLDSPSGSLLNIGDYPQFFNANGETNSEVLFQVDFTSPGASNGISVYWGVSSQYKQNFMAKPFYDTFNSSDIRVKNTAWYQNNATAYPDDPRPINVKKYINGFRDVVQLRRTEAIFIKAECQYHTDPAAAFQTLKTWIVTNRDTAYNKNLTGTAVLDEILDQKGFEFFLEGLRFTDLKRNNRAIIKKQTFNGVPLATVPVGDKRFIWPIPLEEMQNNPNIVQAPGY